MWHILWKLCIKNKVFIREKESVFAKSTSTQRFLCVCVSKFFKTKLDFESGGYFCCCLAKLGLKHRYQGFWNVVLEEILESPLDSKEIEQINPEGNQSWIFIGRPDAEAEAPILWPPDAKSIWKDPDAGKDWRQEKGMTGRDGWMASPTRWTWVNKL